MWCQINAGNPTELNQTHPEIYARAYGDAVPDPPNLDEEVIRSIKAAIPCRRTHQSLQPRSIPLRNAVPAIESICNLPGFQLLGPQRPRPKPALTPSAEAPHASPGMLALLDGSVSQDGTEALALRPSVPPHAATEGFVTKPLQPSVSSHGQTAELEPPGVKGLAENLGTELTPSHPIWQLLPNTFAPKLCEALTPIVLGQKNLPVCVKNFPRILGCYSLGRGRPPQEVVLMVSLLV